DAPLPLQILVDLLGDHELEEFSAGELLARVAEELAEARVVLEEAPLEIGEDHPDRGVLERVAEALLALLQGAVGQHAIGDVDAGAGEPGRLAGRVALGDASRQVPAPAAVLVPDAELALPFAARPVEERLDLREEGPDVLGLEHGGEGLPDEPGIAR